MQKIAAEQRFVGFHLILSTQVASTDTGISTSLRTNLPPQDAARRRRHRREQEADPRERVRGAGDPPTG